MKLVVPNDPTDWPTLGPQVVAFIRAHLRHGPGDLRGQEVRMDTETEAIIYRLYEVFPQEHPQAGRRRFKRGALSRRKGTAKTELAAWIAACELHPDGPVRCDGWDAAGNPVGAGVTDPYVAMIAYTEEQSDELAYAALHTILSEGPLADDFDIGLQRITRKDGSGRAVSLAGAPDARDGARTTFNVFDETHRFTLPRLIEAHQTMLALTAKRKLADAWSLETTTAFVPGEGSVAERTMDYAQAVGRGEILDPRLFFFHRGASDDHDLTTREGVRAAVVEASGLTAEWSDIDAIVAQWDDPTTDRSYFERVWLNRPHQSSAQAFEIERWRELARTDYHPEDQTMIVLGFDGSARSDDAALVAVEVSTGHLWPLGVWHQGEDWDAVRADVTATVVDAFVRWNVWAMFANTDYWADTVATWAGRFRARKRERVVVFDAFRSRTKFAHAVRTFTAAIATGELSHDGDRVLEAHLGNARRADTKLASEDGQLYLIRKERSDSPNRIDAAVAAILAWEARMAAKARGVTGRSAYEDHGLIWI